MQLRLTTMPSEGGETGREGEMGSCKVDQGCNVHVDVGDRLGMCALM